MPVAFIQQLSPDERLMLGAVALGAGLIAGAAAWRMRPRAFAFGDPSCPVEAYIAVLGPEYGQSLAERAWYYAPALHAASDYFGVPRDLMMGLAHTESSFRPEVGSSAGAYGLTQVMPRTAIGLYRSLAAAGEWPFPPVSSSDPERDLFASEGYANQIDRLDPLQSAWMGTAFIRNLLRSGRDVENALAAYNAGGARVQPGDPSSTWPAQTRAYVPAVLRRSEWYDSLYRQC
jgi:soluble lytic murein transglycosylase-like protein